MADYDMTQALFALAGNVSAQIREMKTRAGVTTDSELAVVLGLNQSTVSTWKKRGTVPDGVLLRFDEAVFAYQQRVSVWRFIAARAIAMRVASFMAEESGPNVSGWSSYQMVSMSFNALVDAIYHDLGGQEGVSELATFQRAETLLSDRAYLSRFASWMRELPLEVATRREVGHMRVEAPWRTQTVPQ